MQNLYYNTPGGKLNRGLSVVDTYALLAGKQDGSLSDEEYFKAAVLGWCIELVRLYLLPARLGCLSLKADFFLHVPSPLCPPTVPTPRTSSKRTSSSRTT